MIRVFRIAILKLSSVSCMTARRGQEARIRRTLRAIQSHYLVVVVRSM